MIICTSISPNHINSQKECVYGWYQFGKVYSLNTKDEIYVLEKQYYGVEFVETNRTVKEMFGKGLIQVSAIIDFAKDKKDDLIVVNSDITINHLPVFKTDGISLLTRNDYEEDIAHSQAFVHGFDLYHIPKEYLDIFPPLVYGLGNCFWDLSLGYRAIKKGVKLYWPQGKFIFHKKHENQYSYPEWLKTGRFFKFEFDIDEILPVPQVVNSIMFKIKSTAITT